MTIGSSNPYTQLTNQDLKNLINQKSDQSFVLAATEEWRSNFHMTDLVLKAMAAEFSTIHFFKADINPNSEIAQQLGIHQTPAIIIFKNGQMTDLFTGIISKKQLREKIRPLLNNQQ